MTNSTDLVLASLAVPAEQSFDGPSFRELVEYHYPRSHLSLSASSLSQYVTMVNLLERSIGRTISAVEACTLEVITDFRLWLKANERAATTINSKTREFITLWRYARRKGFVTTFPPDREELPPLKEPKRIPRAWSLEKMQKLIAACHQAAPCHAPRIPRGFDGRRHQFFIWEGRHWVALALLIYDTALRIGAVLKLRIDQVDLEAGTMTVQASQQKDDEEAAFSLHATTVEAIRESLEGRGIFPGCELLFPWPLHARSIWNHLELILRSAGLECGRLDKFHRIRRTSASHAEHARPGTAQQHLGHSDRAMTLRYLDPDIVGKVDVAALLPRFDTAAPSPKAGVR